MTRRRRTRPRRRRTSIGWPPGPPPTRHGPLPRDRPRPGGAAAGVLARRRGRRARSPGSWSRRRRRHAAAVKPNLAFFEAFGSAGLAALERVRAAIPAGAPGRHRREARRHRIDGRAPGRGAVRRPRRGRDHRQPVPRRGGDRAAPRARSTGSPTSCAGRRTRARRSSSRSSSTPRRRATATTAEPLYLRVARRVTAWGPGGTVGLVVGATAPVELAAIRAVAPGLPFLVPGVGAQGGEIDPVLADGPASAAPGRRPRRAADCSSTSRRGIASAACRDDARRARSRRRSDRAAAEWAARLPVLP